LAVSAQAQESEALSRMDPVDRLVQALRAPLDGRTPRDVQLRAAVERLRSLDDLRRALLINEWRDRDPDENIAEVDVRYRTALVERFQYEVRAALHQTDLDGRLAALTIIAALDLHVLGKGETPLARDFTAELIEMTRTGPATHRELAARTLGRIDAEPNAAASALGDLLRDPEPRVRLAAAEALGMLTTTALALAPAGVHDERSRSAAVAAASSALPMAASGLSRSSADVRLRCIEVMAGAADVLIGLIADPAEPDAIDDWTAYQGDVDQEREALRPLVTALKDQAETLARAAGDADVRMRIVARHTLENMAGARLRLMARSSSAATPPAGQGDAVAGARAARFLLEDPLLSGLRQALPALAAGVHDADVESRRAAIDVLEAMGRQATSATPALMDALSDRDRFVRWAAARALGRVGPSGAAVAALARSLGDSDCNVRLAAAGALAAYGPAARAALPDLIAAARAPEPELRLAAVRALEQIGSDDAAALAVLNAALRDEDARVRKTAEGALLQPRDGTPMKTVGSVQPH
jgi:HEAT repeat protein